MLATGHNLDDEVARLTSNTLRWDRAYLSDQGPALADDEGFARKVKPLWRVTEFETANYAFLMGIENHYAPCPYSGGASFSTLKRLWMDLEDAMPGRKIDFYLGFLERGRSGLQAVEAARAKACVLVPVAATHFGRSVRRVPHPRGAGGLIFQAQSGAPGFEVRNPRLQFGQVFQLPFGLGLEFVKLLEQSRSPRAVGVHLGVASSCSTSPCRSNTASSFFSRSPYRVCNGLSCL